MDRDQAILNHLRRYRLTVRPVLDRLIFAGKDPSEVLRRLIRDGKIKVADHALEKNQSYYYLAERKAPGSESVWRDLKILYFCLRGKPRERLVREELESLLGEDVPAASEDHCLMESDDGFVVLRVYTPATDIDNAVRQIRRHLADAKTSPVLRSWIETQQYGFAILTENVIYAQQLKREIEKPQGPEPSLLKQAYIHVEGIEAPKPKDLQS